MHIIYVLYIKINGGEKPFPTRESQINVEGMMELETTI